jgi:hypothetical protein
MCRGAPIPRLKTRSGAASRDDEQRRPAAENKEVSHVQNYFFIETEVAHRRREWERSVMAAEQCAHVPLKNGRTGWSQLAALSLESLRSLATTWLPVPSWNLAGVQCAKTLEGGRASGM